MRLRRAGLDSTFSSVLRGRANGAGKCRSRQVYPRSSLLAGLLIALASCARVVPPPSPVPPVVVPPAPIPPAPPVPPPPENAVTAGVRAGPAVARLGLSEAALRRAFEAFRISCPAIVAREDASGLTRPEEWRAVCNVARGGPTSPAA